MNQEAIRERKGTFTGHEHNHAGGHSNRMRKEAADAQMTELVEGNLPNLFEEVHGEHIVYMRMERPPRAIQGGTIFDRAKRLIGR